MKRCLNYQVKLSKIRGTSQIFILAKQNRNLSEARDILLPRLMDRRIEV